jgi:hypothetical protein
MDVRESGSGRASGDVIVSVDELLNEEPQALRMALTSPASETNEIRPGLSRSQINLRQNPQDTTLIAFLDTTLVERENGDVYPVEA